jgi:hypothetical protein
MQMQILSYVWFDKMADASEALFQRRKQLAEQAVSLDIFSGDRKNFSGDRKSKKRVKRLKKPNLT